MRAYDGEDLGPAPASELVHAMADLHSTVPAGNAGNLGQLPEWKPKDESCTAWAYRTFRPNTIVESYGPGRSGAGGLWLMTSLLGVAIQCLTLGLLLARAVRIWKARRRG